MPTWMPKLHWRSLAVWRRNFKVWQKLFVPSLMLNFGEPFLYLLGLGYGLGKFVGDMQGMPYLMFLASGVVASSAMNTASFEGMYSVFTRMVPQRTHHSMLSAPIAVDDIIAGELLWCATKSMISSCAILLVASALGAIGGGWAALWVVPVAFLVGLAFAGPAIVMATVSNSYDFFNYYFTLVVTPMFIMCGVFYPISTLPEALQTAVQVLPLTHAVELIRPLMAGQPLSNVSVHVAVLLAYALIGYCVAVVLARRRLIA